MKTAPNMKSATLLVSNCLMLLASVMLALAQTTRATDQVPFRGVFDTVAESTVEFPIAYVHVAGAGHATELGLAAFETINQVVNLLTGTGTATYYFAAANGDEVVAEFVFLARPTPTGFALSGRWEITGGSGRFANASGSGITEGNVEMTSQTEGVGHFTMIGTISSPGSLK